MASKQRSFFDQQTSNRTWRSYRPRPPTNADPSIPRAPPPAPPIAPSSQTRKKLGEFRYHAIPENLILPQLHNSKSAGSMASQAHDEASKENIGIGDGDWPGSKSQKNKAVASPEVSRPREFPQTPIARVPFADLVDNGETVMMVSPVKTPPDGVTWKQSPTSSDFPTQRGKKRARSSSPPSSQRSLHFTRPMLAPVNPQDLYQSSSLLAVPGDMDPALDLEKRYFGNTSLVTPSKVPSSAAADLMRSSSPKTPAINLSDSAKLRRTRSCGIAFPTSDTKRMRMAKSYSHVSHNSPTHGDGLQRDPKISKMSLLLDKVDEVLLNQTDVNAATQTSTNGKRLLKKVFQDDSASVTDPNSSVLAAVEENRQSLAQRRDFRENEVYQESRLNALSQEVARTTLHAGNGERSSEYGDHGLDEDLVGLTDKPQSAEQGSKLLDNIVKAPQPDPKTESNNFGEVNNEEDDDFMTDLTVADLEELAATCDRSQQLETLVGSQNASNPKHAAKDGFDITAEEQPLHDQEPEEEKQAVAAVIDLSSDEEFGGDDFDDIARECDALTQVAEQSPSSNSPLIPRYVVKDIYDSVYTTEKGYTRGEKVLHLSEHRSKVQRVVSLREAWLDSPVDPGVTVHVLARFDNRGSTVVDNSHGLLIIHPDHLFSATVVADAFKCTRRAVLQDRVKATNEVSESQVYGNILHEVFQEALKANEWDRPFFESTVRVVATRFLESLFELNKPIELCVQELLEKSDGLEAWAKSFVSAQAQPDALMQGPNGSGVPIGINKLLDVEEHIWSPRYGLKGNIDATVQVHTSIDGYEKTLTVPFELKTGRARNDTSHNSQTALYTLLLSDRYDVHTAFGMLHYLETNSTNQVLAPRRDILHMIMRRNDLAAYARKRDTLPPMLQSEFTCSRCYAQTSCLVYHKLAESGDAKSSGLGEKFKELVGHLKPVHADFFRKWDDLLTKEEGDVLRFRPELWSMLSAEREKVGRCFGGVVIKTGGTTERPDLPKINRFEYVFAKRKPTPGFSFAESQLSVGEPIVISDEAGHYALANGYVTRIRTREIAVAVDRRLHNARVRSANFDAENNQAFAGIMEVGVTGTAPEVSPEPLVYRIDKDEFSNGMATVRNNLIRMMEKGLFGANMLRRLIVEGVAPTFRSDAASIALADRHEDLNDDQRNAIRKVMSADHYALVLGMPGTGKTTTIAHIIRALAAKGKSVLLTSYTHTAVDNILLKIRDADLSILRIGAETKVHPEVQEFADLACRPKSSFEAIQRSYQSEVVATTCLGINHPIFNQRTFDYCIVDEASQITLPVCLGPIRMAHRFVLVGDHYQLPPLVQNKAAQEGGLDISLFKLLSDQHPESVVNLEHQYRMCEDVMSLSNSIIYRGLLKCGTPAVATRQIEIPNPDGLKQHHHSLSTLCSQLAQATSPCTAPSMGTCWLRDVVEPQHRVLFLNTDPCGAAARDISNGSRVTNPFEIALTSQVVRALLSVGVPAAEVGIMTLYRSQLALLRQALRPRVGSADPGPVAPMAALEMHTADKFQGRDKEAIILSLVRSNDRGAVGDLLQDWRRVNVALTRARTKLVLVGSFATMRQSGNQALVELCQIVDRKGWRYDLKDGCLGQHWFEDGVTQVSGILSSPRKGEMASPARKPTFREGKMSPVKCGKGLAPERILKSRPVLRDIVNGVAG